CVTASSSRRSATSRRWASARRSWYSGRWWGSVIEGFLPVAVLRGGPAPDAHQLPREHGVAAAVQEQRAVVAPVGSGARRGTGVRGPVGGAGATARHGGGVGSVQASAQRLPLGPRLRRDSKGDRRAARGDGRDGGHGRASF